MAMVNRAPLCPCYAVELLVSLNDPIIKIKDQLLKRVDPEAIAGCSLLYGPYELGDDETLGSRGVSGDEILSLVRPQ